MLNITRFRMGKQKRHLFQCSAWIFAGLLFASTLSAQFGTQALPDQDIGRPTQAPFITFLGIVDARKARNRPVPASRRPGSANACVLTKRPLDPQVKS